MKILKELEKTEKQLKKAINKLSKTIIPQKYLHLFQEKELENLKLYISHYTKITKIGEKKYEYKATHLLATIEKNSKQQTETITHGQSKRKKKMINILYNMIKSYQEVKRAEKTIRNMDKIKRLLIEFDEEIKIKKQKEGEWH